MPAGDAGRPYGTPAGENALDVANKLRTEVERLREEVAEWESAHSVVAELRSLIESHMNMARGQWRCVAQVAAQQAVVDAARAVRNCMDDANDAVWDHQGDGACLDQLNTALDRLDQAQAAQPEGERAR